MDWLASVKYDLTRLRDCASSPQHGRRSVAIVIGQEVENLLERLDIDARRIQLLFKSLHFVLFFP